ncbi:MAG TPA: HAMP domain-containing sensor histidine kinase [Caulobacteraceae bacterium]|jgi:cell cycle sensor histidine kinase DivJ|nr:HAMP domain-containing sensor histidine kinase [Caulobacteraceae bacterium]
MAPSDVQIEGRALQGAAIWHGCWLAFLGGVALAWPTPIDSILNYAIAAAAAPGLVGLLLRWIRGPFVKGLVVVAWPIGVSVAIVMSGGLTGPLAAVALAPAAAMAVMDSRRFVGLGTALTLASIAAVVLAGFAGLNGPLPASGPWLPLVIIAIEALFLAAALQLGKAHESERVGARDEEAARLRTLLDAGPFLVLRLDGANVIREAFCGAPEDWDHDLLGRHFESLAAESDRPMTRVGLGLLHDTGMASLGFSPPMAPDRYFAAELRGLEHGEAIAVIRDASRERAYEAHLEQAKSDAENQAQSRSRFLANMSHELRTPLNAIIGFSDIMRSKLFGPMPERYAEYAGLIHESGGHLLDLINDVLDMSKIEADRFSLTLEPFDAREAVSAALRLTRVQADTAKIGLRGALPPQPIDVIADRRAIKQIVLNLVSNALKFTPTGGQVNVVAREIGGELEIIVADTGVGISPADLERLGKPYEQAGDADQRSMGTGLGLSLVRAFAELHGGRMVIKSVLGEGTAVTIHLPVLEHEGRPFEPAPSPDPDTSIRTAVGDNVIAFSPHR